MQYVIVGVFGLLFVTTLLLGAWAIRFGPHNCCPDGEDHEWGKWEPYGFGNRHSCKKCGYTAFQS